MAEPEIKETQAGKDRRIIKWIEHWVIEAVGAIREDSFDDGYYAAVKHVQQILRSP